MEVFRLVKSTYARELNGKGAALYGGRWNSKGVELIYTASNRSLAMVEVLVSLPINQLPTDLVMLTLALPDDIAQINCDLNTLPQDWNRFPAIAATCQIGDHFVHQNEACLLRVPSVVTQGDFNYLINPGHRDFSFIRITQQVPFPLDKRFLRQSIQN